MACRYGCISLAVLRMYVLLMQAVLRMYVPLSHVQGIV